ncbi:retention module-containing protein [Chromobacterium sp. ATCC 53434]|uniref:retention module-containing protein n=1 Tax=Chromobacterium sp. (strain ATCC 53434 / SC 14030) TaxID=2059672 RepID=UPI0013051498|nr:retention module-containing protein [Chromobacterium sp. ATCC 53434]
MATSTQGHILALQGSVKAIGIDGKVRLLKAGDALLPGEQLQLENGAAIDISQSDGQMLHIDGTRQVMLTEEVLHAQHADATEAAIAPLTPEAQQILAALDNPNPGPNANPFDNLDPAAAGLSDPGGENSGHSFIRLGRITESLAALQQESAPISTAATQTALSAANETPDSPPFFTAANGAPLGNDLSVTTKEDTPVSGTLTASDPDGDPLTFVKGSDPAHGVVVINPNGSWTYTPGQDYNGSDKFTVTVNDGRGGTATVTVNVGVTPVNDPAVFGGNDHGVVVEDDITQVSGTLVVKDSDPGEAGFQPQADIKVDYGTFHFDSTTGQWTFTLDNAKAQALTNADRFDRTFTIQSLDGTTHTVTVTIQGKDDPAIITGDNGTVTEDQNVSASNTLDYNGKLNIVDPDQGQAVFNTTRVDSQAGNLGALTIDANGNWHYSVDNAKVQYLGQGDTRTESFTVYSQDGTTHNVVVVVNGVNDPASIGGAGDIGDGTVKEDTPAQTVASGKLTVVDIDQGQAQLQPSQQVTDYGTFQANADGTWTFTINNGSAKVQALGEGDTVPLQFTVASKDGTATSVVTIHVLGTNDAAVIGGTDNGTVIEDKLLDVGGVLTVKDADQGQSFFQAQTNTAGTYGTFSIDASGNWHYNLNNSDPIVQALNQGESRVESFTVKSADGTTSTVTVTIIGTNDPAVITGNDHGAVTEDLNVSAANTLDYTGTLIVTDPDQGQSAIDPTRVDSKAGNLGSITIDASGNWHYTVDNAKVQYLGQGDTLTEVFTVYSKDGTSHDITVIVNGVNDIPVFSGSDHGAVTEDLNVSAANTLDYTGTLTVTDPDQGQSAIDPTRVDSKAGNLGSITIDASGNWHYTVDNAKVQYLGQGDTLTEVFTVYSKDGTSHDITVIVNGVNDIPVFSGSDHGAVTEDLNVSAANTLDYTGTLTVTDPDQGQSAIDPTRVDSKAGNLGSITIDASGNWHYTVDNAKVQYLGQGDTLTEVFTVYSKDGTSHDITVIVNGVNDIPVFSGSDRGAVTEDLNVSAAHTLDASGTLIVTDPDQNQSAIDPSRVDSKAGNLGSLTIDASGNWHYSVNDSLSGVQSLGQGITRQEVFTVYSKDGTAHDITVVITGVNDAARISGVTSQDMYTDQASISNSFTVSDVDAGESGFSTSLNVAETYGTFNFDKTTGIWTFTLNASAQNLTSADHITYSYTITSIDGTTHPLSITINGIDHFAPSSGGSQGIVTASLATAASTELLSAKLDAATPDKTAIAHHADAVSRETSIAAAGHAKASAGEIAATETHRHGAASDEPGIVYGAQKTAVEPAGNQPSPSIAHDAPHSAEAGARGGTGIDTFKWTLGEQSAAATPEPARSGFVDHGQRDGKDALDLKDVLPEGGHRAASLDSYLNAHKESADAATDARHSGPGAPAAQSLASVDLTHAIALSDAQVLKNLLSHGQQHTE